MEKDIEGNEKGYNIRVKEKKNLDHINSWSIYILIYCLYSFCSKNITRGIEIRYFFFFFFYYSWRKTKDKKRNTLREKFFDPCCI